MSGKFYLAAPYNTRDESLHKVREIERLSGWTCNARWVLGMHDGKEPDLCVRDDYNDLRDADALILLDGVSSTGGMWVELGMAIALSKKVIFVRENANLLTKPPVFCSLPEVIWVRNHQTAAEHLRRRTFRDAELGGPA